MGILGRFSEIMSANINALLDKCEDPAKMIDQTLRNLKESYAEVKQGTAEMMAQETAKKRELDEAKAKIQDYSIKAERAVQAGNDDDARILLEEVAKCEGLLPKLQQNYDVAHANATKMRQMHDKLRADISSLEEQRAAIKGQLAMAKSTEKVADAMSSVKTARSVEAFDKYKEKAQSRLDAAMAKAELNATPENQADSIAAKYGGQAASSDVEARLAALKAKNNM